MRGRAGGRRTQAVPLPRWFPSMGTRLTIRASVLVSFKASSVSPFTLGLAGCSLSESTITSGEGALLSDFMSLWNRNSGRLLPERPDCAGQRPLEPRPTPRRCLDSDADTARWQQAGLPHQTSPPPAHPGCLLSPHSPRGTQICQFAAEPFKSRDCSW